MRVSEDCAYGIDNKINKMNMRRYLIVLFACLIAMGATEAWAQAPRTGNRTTSTKNAKGKTTKRKGGKDSKKGREQPPAVQLPSQSNDCLFAIPLQADVAYGPTTAPQGAGRLQEIVRDKNNRHVFEFEHNTVWYKFVAPYNGDLNIAITQENPMDDYDFLVYKYTDVYFSNHLIQNKIKPIAACLTAVDSATQPRGVTIGMDSTGSRRFLGKEGIGRFVSPIPVKKGEEYYIVLDNVSNKGAGHTIKVSVHVDCFTPTVQFYDPKIKKFIDVDLLILEKNTDNRAIVKSAHFKNERVRLVPGFDYTLYAKKDGYFSVFKEFNADICKEDTLLRFIMKQAKVGTVLPITDIYFSDDVKLLEVSDTSLLSYVAMFRNHPAMRFKIKGYVQSYGIDMERDIKMSQTRAEVVRQFFIEHGVEADRMTVAGMSENEIRRSAAAALNRNQPFNDAKVELIITEIVK